MRCTSVLFSFVSGSLGASLAQMHRRCQCAECSRDPRVADTLCSPLTTLVMFSDPVRENFALRSVLLVRKSFARMWNLIVAGFSKKFVVLLLLELCENHSRVSLAMDLVLSPLHG